MYTFHKYENTARKYSKQIEEHLREQSDFIEKNNLEKYYWSDKNSKSILQDYYPFSKVSIVDKIHLPKLFPSISVPTVNVKTEIRKDSVYFLKPCSKFIGNSNGILISKDINYLAKYAESNEGIFIIQREIKPDLLNGYKYDIRMYILVVYNNSILYIYIYPGILRLCKEKYVEGSIDPSKQITIYGDFVEMQSIDIHIKYIIYKTLLQLKPQTGKVGYQYLGYDIIKDSKGKYHLIEVNIQPSLERIKYKIIKDFAKLVARPVTTSQGYDPFMATDGKITLSELNLSHYSDLYKITSDINVMQYIGNLKTWSPEKTRRFIQYGNNADYYFMAVLLQNKLIGIVGRAKDKLTIYFNPNYTAQGLAKLALHLFLKITTGPLLADVLKSNSVSLRFFKAYSSTTLSDIVRFQIRQ